VQPDPVTVNWPTSTNGVGLGAPPELPEPPHATTMPAAAIATTVRRPMMAVTATV